jgi:hypothetical protein
LRSLGYISRHRYADATQYLNALSNSINQLILVAVMPVEKQMQLIERRTCYLSMTFLVRAADSAGWSFAGVPVLPSRVAARD